jgi:three-Cys-motif partner protein
MKENEQKEGWGGPWTERKLEAFSKYVWSYLTIMKEYPFWETIYFDGFAGSGNRKTKPTDLFTQLQITLEEEHVYKGAAERVLSLPENLSFDYHYFIDTNSDALDKLKGHLGILPGAKGKKLVYRSGDANHWLLELSKALQKKRPAYAALVFLDPFGMHINWESIAALKGTRSDIWILIPTGVIVNRLLDKAGKLKHIDKLQSFFGLSGEEIREAFYQVEAKKTLFGEEEVIRKVLKPIEKIAGLYIQQLKTVWKFVTEQPLKLENTRGVPIFHFVFASNKSNAVKIAKQIIQKL